MDCLAIESAPSYSRLSDHGYRPIEEAIQIIQFWWQILYHPALLIPYTADQQVSRQRKRACQPLGMQGTNHAWIHTLLDVKQLHKASSSQELATDGHTPQSTCQLAS
jgi:hypothetical protein